jgi:uncharacterized protein YdgA (DUF945 family)
VKKITIIVLALLAALVMAPWGIGQLAEKRVNAGLDRIVLEAPYLSIVERSWTRGWFRSEQQITIEVVGPWARAMNPATVLEEFKKTQEAGEAAMAAEEAANAAPADSEPARSAEPSPAAEPDAAASPETPAETAPIPPVRFTIRNEILHGPVLWPASLGIARVNTKVDLGPEVRKKIMEYFGTDEPVRMSTRVGFLGGGTTRFYGDGRSIKLKDGGTLEYDDYELDISYSGDLDDIDGEGSWPQVNISNQDGSKVVVNKVTLTSTSERIQGDLYDTDFSFLIDTVRVIAVDKSESVVEGVHYVVDTGLDKEFMNVGAKLGTGNIKSKALEDLKLEVREAHYDFTVRRLHAETLAKLSTEFKEMYGKPIATVADMDAVMMAPLKQYGLELLKYDPEFVFDRIGLSTPDGDGYIKGVVRLKGVTAQDLELGFMPLVGKLDVDINIEVAQKLVEKMPSGAASAGAAIDAGYLKRDGDKLVSHIEFKKGELKVNGKAQGIPGLGGPPAAAEGMPPAGEEAAVPQE